MLNTNFTLTLAFKVSVVFVLMLIATPPTFADSVRERTFQRHQEFVDVFCRSFVLDGGQCVLAEIEVAWNVRFDWNNLSDRAYLKLVDKFFGVVKLKRVDSCDNDPAELLGVRPPCSDSYKTTDYQVFTISSERAGTLNSFKTNTERKITQKDVGKRSGVPSLNIGSDLTWIFAGEDEKPGAAHSSTLYGSSVPGFQLVFKSKSPIFTPLEMVDALSSGEVSKTIRVDEVISLMSHQRVSGTAELTIRPQQKVCGPDISDQLKDVLRRIKLYFRQLTKGDKMRACAFIQSLDPINLNAGWDICQLYLGETEWLYKPEFRNEDCGTPYSGTPGTGSIESRDTSPCGNSVQVGDNCYLAGTVNYAMYGAIAGLCNTAHGSFSLKKMETIIQLYKKVTFDDPWPPFAWAKWGYQGVVNDWPIASIPQWSAINRWDCAVRCSSETKRQYCTDKCSIEPKEEFDFRWLPVRKKCLPFELRWLKAIDPPFALPGPYK